MAVRSHQLSIPDDLWERFQGSGMAMRNALYMTDVKPVEAPPVIASPNGEVPWGTLFISRKLTACLLCRTQIPPRMEAVQTSWTRPGRHPSVPVEKGLSGAVHVECAERFGVEVRWSVERILGDLRASIAGIKHRKLKRQKTTSVFGAIRRTPERDTRYDHLPERERREAIRESNQRAGGDYYGG